MLKVFDKNLTTLHVNNIREVRDTRHKLNITKAICSKPIVNIKINGEEFEAIPIKSVTREGCKLSLYQSNIALAILATVIRQVNEIHGNQTEKKGVKLFWKIV